MRNEWRLRLQCPSCGHPVEEWIDAPAPDLTAETAHDGETTADFDMVCGTCGEITFVEVVAQFTGWTAHLLYDREKSVTIDHFDYQDDEWIEQLAPVPHPFDNYRIGYDEWTGLLHRIGDRRSGTADTNRLLLIQLFSIVEAYLSDAIINYVYDAPEICSAVVAWHPELKSESVSLLAVAKNPDFVRDIVVEKLRRTQFHRFEHVNGLLRASLDHYLLPSSKHDRSKIMAAAKTRHDCVHRNGRDHNGNIVDWITVPYLEELGSLFHRMIMDLVGKFDEIELRKEKARHLEEVEFFGAPF